MTKEIVYGVDDSKALTPADVRDALVTCFLRAHKEVVEDLLANSKDESNEQEFERLKLINIRQLIRIFFAKDGGDFDKPTKESLFKVIGRMKDFSASYRKPEIIEKHYNEIADLISKINTI
jgi:hypothetical protein